MKYHTLIALVSTAIISPIYAEDVPQVDYSKAATKSDALDKQTTDEAVRANYNKAQTKSEALEEQSRDEAVDVNYDKAQTKSEALEKHEATDNLIATIQSKGLYDTFIAAVEAAELTTYLTADDTEVTVFLPSDEAFAALPEGTLENLLKPENKDKLAAVLKYHIVPGRIMAEDVTSAEIETLNGDTFTVIKTAEGKVTVNDANVLITDMEATNGVIHTVDKVIIPES